MLKLCKEFFFTINYFILIKYKKEGIFSICFQLFKFVICPKGYFQRYWSVLLMPFYLFCTIKSDKDPHGKYVRYKYDSRGARLKSRGIN